MSDPLPSFLPLLMTPALRPPSSRVQTQKRDVTSRALWNTNLADSRRSPQLSLPFSPEQKHVDMWFFGGRPQGLFEVRRVGMTSRHRCGYLKRYYTRRALRCVRPEPQATLVVSGLIDLRCRRLTPTNSQLNRDTRSTSPPIPPLQQGRGKAR